MGRGIQSGGGVKRLCGTVMRESGGNGCGLGGRADTLLGFSMAKLQWSIRSVPLSPLFLRLAQTCQETG